MYKQTSLYRVGERIDFFKAFILSQLSRNEKKRFATLRDDRRRESAL